MDKDPQMARFMYRSVSCTLKTNNKTVPGVLKLATEGWCVTNYIVLNEVIKLLILH